MYHKKTLILSLISVILVTGFVTGCGKTATNGNNNVTTSNVNAPTINVNRAGNTAASRIDFYTAELQSAADKSYSAVVFTSGSKFVQFEVGGTFYLDVPHGQLTGDMTTKLLSLLGSAAESGEVSVNAEFESASEAAQATENIFITVYGLAENYEVTSRVIK